MEETKKLCDTCNWFDPECQLCYESGRYMIVRALYCWAYDPMETEEITIMAGKDYFIRMNWTKGEKERMERGKGFSDTVIGDNHSVPTEK
jgi:hypothetical protein